ncbi:MAG: hypothetical protein ABSH09_21050 [Bryobacteraceae bacterium]|jgi:hypothetical protein
MPPRSAIPDDQLERVQPTVDTLLAKLRALMERLPPTTDSALEFRLTPEDRD